jgi:hypothetical protein
LIMQAYGHIPASPCCRYIWARGFKDRDGKFATEFWTNFDSSFSCGFDHRVAMTFWEGQRSLNRKT